MTIKKEIHKFIEKNNISHSEGARLFGLHLNSYKAVIKSNRESNIEKIYNKIKEIQK